jgi:modulator of FtsH protease
MQDKYQVYSPAQQNALATNKVIKNTYLLLSATVIFSAITALISMQVQLNLSFVAVLAGYIGLLFLTHKTANTAFGIISTFAFTGFMGLTLGPILNHYIHNFNNGPQIVSAALGSTGVIFFALSGYALSTKRDFSYLAGFLFVGISVLVIASLASIFFNVPAVHLAISAVSILLMSGYILYETSELINGGQTNYILATVSLYMNLFNIFVNLLRLFSALSNNRD